MKKKKIVSSFLVGLLLFSSQCHILAGTVENQTITGNTQSEVLVSLEIGSTYSISVPKTIQLNEDTKSAEYQISIDGVISDSQYISVTPNTEFVMTDGYMEVMATVSQDRTEWQAEDLAEGDKIANGVVSAESILIGSWSGSFQYDIRLNDKRFSLTVVDESGTDLNATGMYIVGEKKTELLQKLVDKGFVLKPTDVNALIDVKADMFSGMATATFDVSSFAEVGEAIAFYHYDESNGWEYIGMGQVNEEKSVIGTFTAFSPVAMVVDKAHVHTDRNGDRACDDCLGETDCHVHAYEENSTCLCGHQCTHEYSSVITKETSCLEAGSKTYTCNSCNHSYVEEIAILPHTYQESGACKDCGDLEPGLYNISGLKLASWAEAGIDIEKDYTQTGYSTNTVSGYYVLSKIYPTTTKLVIPETVSKLGAYSLCNCSSLKEVVIKGGANKTLEIGETAFGACSALEKLQTDKQIVSIGDKGFTGCKLLVQLPSLKSLISLGEAAFYNCSALYGTLVIGDSVRYLYDDTFYGCANLTGVVLPANLYAIKEEVFRDCIRLKEITFNSKLTAIGQLAFKNCSALRSITLPTSLKTISAYAFEDCSKLASVSYNGVTYTLVDTLTSALKAGSVSLGAEPFRFSGID